MRALPKQCANCRAPMPGQSGSVSRGRDIAWLVHCKECAALVNDQLELVEDRPNGASIQIWECRNCGMRRACRPRWLTRCQVCLDERTSLDAADVAHLKAILKENRLYKTFIAEVAEVRPSEVTPKTVTEVLSQLAVLAELERMEQHGWTLLANDVHGPPFWAGERRLSHGTWARHDLCGTVQKMDEGRTECRSCPARPESRTHRARTGTPQLLSWFTISIC